ncbi:DUF4012 domain-containing protein [Patescibacteria group bacterium]|nr:DUF4012 domain-containing protein [Patescibacteria group bacterium]
MPENLRENHCQQKTKKKNSHMSEKKHSMNFAGRTRKTKKGKNFSKKWLYYAGGIVALIAVLFAFHYPYVKSAYEYALAGQEDFVKAQGAIGAQDFSGAKKALITAEEKLNSAKDDLKKLGKFKFIPIVGRQIRAVENILTATIQLGTGLQDLADLGDAVFSPLNENGTAVSLAKISPEQTEAILKTIYESPPLLQGVKADIDLAVDAINNIPDTGLIGSIKKIVTPLKEQLPAIQTGLELAMPAAEAIPQIAGYPSGKTYLFLLQNNTELRPTGGFIGTYGILKLENGAIEQFNTDNIYNLDTPYHGTFLAEPPWQLEKYLSADKWFMRDSNWSPDFPTAAEQAEWFYHKEGGTEEKIDGVIAVTPTFIESLIALTGEIEVNGVTFTSDNFIDTLQYQVEQGYYRQGISESERKEIIGDLASKLLDQVLELPSDRWSDMWETFQKDIASKHILLYLKDQAVQQLITKQGWGGSVRSVDGDYFLVVDANMASLKSDPGVLRTINYTVENNDDGDYVATLKIHYNNQGTFNWKSTRYRTYTRVYVPLGSELINYEGVMENDKLHGGGSGDVEIAEEFDKTMFGGFISIEPQEQGELVYTYKLPTIVSNQIDNDEYTLFAQKQAGTAAYELVVNLDFDKKIDSYTPIDKAVQDGQNRVTFPIDLGQDREFKVIFK